MYQTWNIKIRVIILRKHVLNTETIFSKLNFQIDARICRRLIFLHTV
jgi:hypothetical protein